ncbi:hypothetical protein [Salinibacillus xinjiangensis]|uniref:Uncharacterized protein n=1 Tax=Salinibacillus xinjiangensis TaxID=1229268 RepID=A0A6G1X7N1_9BACI|nr:hypothetical protein [Salinibacillus xinjiangensis]MRG87011.1 hypothetical protein [Salinibacillus xinjiangensis]
MINNRWFERPKRVETEEINLQGKKIKVIKRRKPNASQNRKRSTSAGE